MRAVNIKNAIPLPYTRLLRYLPLFPLFKTSQVPIKSAGLPRL